MNTIEQAYEILEQMRLDGIPDEDLQVDDVLIEENGQLLIRSATLTYLAGDYYLGVNYGVWYDREMYDRRIYGEYLEDGEEVVYYTALAGSEDEEMI
ncbi:MAG: hypothetical protein WD907_01510, partial [Bacilli bacterium]